MDYQQNPRLVMIWALIAILLIPSIYLRVKINSMEKKLLETTAKTDSVISFINQAIANQPK